MPTYVYKCPLCEWKIEVQRKIEDRDKPIFADHDVLHQRMFIRVPSPFNFKLEKGKRDG